MEKGSWIAMILLALASLMTSASGLRSAKADWPASDLKRMRFQIAAIRERGAEREIISSSVIEGPPGLDFDIDLQGSRFKMKAKFLTDLDESRALKVRAELQTRRLYGYSKQGLPLYEEDQQEHELRLGLDEDIALLPFGQAGGDERLKLEITPAMTDEPVYDPKGEMRPLAIKILKTSEEGWISIRAAKIPHRYEVEASLLEDGREIARGAATFLFKEAQELLLQPETETGESVALNPLAVYLKIDEYARTRPSDEAAINFDIYRIDARAAGKREAVGLNWSGIARLGSDLRYDLSEQYQPRAGKKYELRFNIKIAKGEIAN